MCVSKCYLYRAIESQGATIEFFLSAFRDLDAAKCLFRRVLRNSTQSAAGNQHRFGTVRLRRKLSRKRQRRSHLYYRRCSSRTATRHKENAMQEFINKYRDEINGTLSGLDRLVFRGSLRRLNYGRWNH